jgi:hypothetical protein
VQPVDSDPDPAHDAPPYCGVGLVHVLDLLLVPDAQVTEHDDHDVQEVQPPLIGHIVATEHTAVSQSAPSQPSPPYCGGGFVHVLYLVYVPQHSQVTEHVP